MVDALELLKTWPGWSHAGSETILASPAWRFTVCVGETSRTLVRTEEALVDPIELTVTFDGVPAILSLADAAVYPDLHLLWSRRGALPPEVVLALVEKECGGVFSLLEEATRRQFGVVGFATESPRNPYAFAVQGAGEKLIFSLELPAELLPIFGSLENLDPAHPVIRESTREAWADYWTLAVTDEELAAVRTGDFLLCPEDTGRDARWVTELPKDEGVHVLGATSRMLTFAAFAEDALPPIPDPVDLVLVKDGREFATAQVDRVGMATALRVVERK